MTESFFDHTASVTNENPFSGVAGNFGNRFHLTVDADLTAIWYWAGGAPDAGVDVGVWDVTDGAWAHIDVAPTWTTETDNWAHVAVDPPVALVAGHDYEVVAHVPGGVTWYYQPGGTYTTGNTNLVWDNTVGAGSYSVAASDIGYTDGGAYTGNQYTIDVEIGTGGGGGGGSATAQDLEDWLVDSSANTHKDTDAVPGLPWTTKQVVDANATILGRLNDLSDAAITWLNDRSSDAINLLNEASQSWVDFLNTASARLTGSDGNGGSAFQAVNNNVAGVQQGVDDLGALCATIAPLLREQLTLSPDLSDTARWTLVGTVTGEGDGLVELQADLYVLTLTWVGTGVNHHVIAGTEWFPRWGWVAPRQHGNFRERQFPDLSPCAITAGHLLMDGLLVYAHPGVTWQVDAYVLDR